MNANANTAYYALLP